MEIFNIGPLELLIFLILAFVLLGPKDMVLTAYKIGQAIRKFVRSPVWREILRSAQEIRELPTKLMDDTGLQQELEAIKKDTQDTVKEVNASMNEATKAMRVPEAEHIKLETGPKIEPAAGTIPAASQSSVESVPSMPAVFSGPPIPGLAQIPATDKKIGESEPIPGDSDSEIQAVVEPEAQAAVEATQTEPGVAAISNNDVVEPVGEKPKRVSRKKTQKVAESDPIVPVESHTEDVAVIPEAKTPKRTSRKKSAKVEVVDQDVILPNEDAGVTVNEIVEERPKRGKSRKTEIIDIGDDQAHEDSKVQASVLEPANGPESSAPMEQKPKKTSRRKPVEVAVVDEVSGITDLSPIAEPLKDIAATATTQPEVEQPEKPGRKKGIRKKESDSAAVDFVESNASTTILAIPEPDKESNNDDVPTVIDPPKKVTRKKVVSPVDFGQAQAAEAAGEQAITASIGLQKPIDMAESQPSLEIDAKKPVAASRRKRKVSEADNGHSNDIELVPVAETSKEAVEPETQPVVKRSRSPKRTAPAE